MTEDEAGVAPLQASPGALGSAGGDSADSGGAGTGDGSEPSAAAPPLVSLTRLEPVPVAAVWPTEARHFTPWLLQSSDLLSQVLGIDIQLESREYKVGKFSLDIIGREVETGSPVIIENQYGPTDHGHLGQILTYAGGTKPATVIWVAEEFREEHRAALEWLNAHTDPEIRFFGVRLAAVTLTGAPAGLIAPFLELVVKPNEWEKQAAAATLSGTTGRTPTQDLYRQFWSEFEPRAKERGWTSASAPRAELVGPAHRDQRRDMGRVIRPVRVPFGTLLQGPGSGSEPHPLAGPQRSQGRDGRGLRRRAAVRRPAGQQGMPDRIEVQRPEDQ